MSVQSSVGAKKRVVRFAEGRGCLKSQQQKEEGGRRWKHKESKFRRHGQYLLESHLFYLACFLLVLLWSDYSVSPFHIYHEVRCYLPANFVLHLVCSGPSRRNVCWTPSLSIVLRIERGSLSFTTSENCRQLHNSGQHVYALKSGCCLLQFYF